jgi:hypothetical protein
MEAPSGTQDQIRAVSCSQVLIDQDPSPMLRGQDARSTATHEHSLRDSHKPETSV